MEAHQVVRIERQPCTAEPTTSHVVAVATGNATIYNRVWSADEVTAAIEQGVSFYTQPADGDGNYPVHCVRCQQCGAAAIKLIRFDGPTFIYPPHW